MSVADITSREYHALAEFRYQIRRFLHFSETAAKEAGIEAQQHQLMLAVRANEPQASSIGYLAERLQLRHHSVVGLVDRLEKAGLARRVRSVSDRRSAEVKLTAKGVRILRDLTLYHREELRSAIPALIGHLESIWKGSERKHAKSA